MRQPSLARAADDTGFQKSGAASRGIQTLSHSLTHELVAGSRSHKCVYEHIASPPSHDFSCKRKTNSPSFLNRITHLQNVS